VDPDDSQLSFLPQPNQYSSWRFRSQEPQLELGIDRLQQWKQQIADYQKQVKIAPATQGNLFAIPNSHADPELIDPFSLTRSSFQFYTWPNSRQADEPVIYFVFDDQVPLLLYIGQAVKAHQRWAGVHDCKEYVDNYICANYQHQQKTAVCTAFWWNTPSAFKPRLQLEAKLIAKWRSPFNKENRKSWATPFTQK